MDEDLKNEIKQAITSLNEQLVGQQDAIERFNNLRTFLSQQGFSTSVPDAMIAEWEGYAQRTRHHIDELNELLESA